MSFLQRLLGQRKRGSDVVPLGPTLISNTAGQEKLKSEEPHSEIQDAQAAKRVNSLFAFVDPKDPFSPGEIAGEELPGPILSIMSAKQFRFLLLFHTPHPRQCAGDQNRGVAQISDVSSVRARTVHFRSQGLLVIDGPPSAAGAHTDVETGTVSNDGLLRVCFERHRGDEGGRVSAYSV